MWRDVLHTHCSINLNLKNHRLKSGSGGGAESKTLSATRRCIDRDSMPREEKNKEKNEEKKQRKKTKKNAS